MNDLSMRDPLDDLRAALLSEQTRETTLGFAHLDPRRERRKGVPEVVLADVKTPEQVVAIARRLLADTGRAIISRLPDATLAALQQELADTVVWEHHAAARLVVLRHPEHQPPRSGGQVGILTAGTGDVPRAEEAAVVCREMGCDVHAFYDVGVAGIHRLVAPLQHLLSVPVDVIIVAAGMDGALPSVVAGLAPVPVIGLPTAIGYGLGGRGEAALLSMLQTCAPGLAVVNIDNGVGAGAMAGLIANNAARARRQAAASADG